MDCIGQKAAMLQEARIIAKAKGVEEALEYLKLHDSSYKNIQYLVDPRLKAQQEADWREWRIRGLND